MNDLRDRFSGCLLGLAVGSALGAPLEGMDASAIARRHGFVTEMQGGGRAKMKPGQWTGDVQTMLCVAESLADKNDLDPIDIAARLVEWMKSEPADICAHTKGVLDRTARGTEWKAASTTVQRLTPTSADNASLARAVPVALFDWGEPALLQEHARLQSEITHAHQECQWSCALLASFVAHAMNTGVRDLALDRALDECKNAPGHLRKRATLAPGKLRADLMPGSYVLDTLDCALWAMMNSDDFEHAVTEAVNLGADADCIGAVCGAMAGAFYGARAIPERWLNVLAERGHITSLAMFFADRQRV